MTHKKSSQFSKNPEKESLRYYPDSNEPVSYERMVQRVINNKSIADELINEFVKDDPSSGRKDALEHLRSCGVYYSKLPQ